MLPRVLDDLPQRSTPTPTGSGPTDRLLDALVELLVRLHLAGFFWGDCSLSNTLFRLDAGALQAIFVDAETSELHPSLSDGQREYDVELGQRTGGRRAARPGRRRAAAPRCRAGRAGRGNPRRYQQLWDALTDDVIIRPEDQRYRIAERLRRLNDLGFDADEVELVSAGERLPAAHPDPGGRAGPQPLQPAHPDRPGRPGKPGPPPAQRHRLVPRLPGEAKMASGCR